MLTRGKKQIICSEREIQREADRDRPTQREGQGGRERELSEL